MNDLVFVSVEDSYLIFENASGERFRVVMDDQLKNSLKTSSRPKFDMDSLTPREIQERVRLGETPEQIAESARMELDFVMNFAQPVLDEIQHVLETARSIRLTIGGSRHSDSEIVEFGEVVDSNLTRLLAKAIKWSAHRTEGHDWSLNCDFESSGDVKRATWSFDLRRLTLSPENKLAASLSSRNSKTEDHAPKLTSVTDSPLPVQPDPDATVVLLAPDAEHPSLNQRGKTATEGGESSQAIAPADRNDSGPVSFLADRRPAPSTQVQDSNSLDDGPLSATADLLEALRKKRAERANAELSTGQQDLSSSQGQEAESGNEITQEVPEEAVVDQSDLSYESSQDLYEDGFLNLDRVELTGQDESVLPEAPDDQRMPDSNVLPSKKGRSSIPSWDEIVFGSKPEDN